MANDDFNLSATDTPKQKASARRPQPTYTPPPPPPSNPTSPWVPFSLNLFLIIVCVGGVFYFMDLKLKELHNSILKTNDFVVGLDRRTKLLEDKLIKTDADLNQAGNSVTGQLINLDSRLGEAEKALEKNEKGIGWNSTRIKKVEGVENDIESLTASISKQDQSIAKNINEIQALSAQIEANEASQGAVEQLSKRIKNNEQALETVDTHRSRLSSAIQKVQSDTARLIRLYEKDNPSAKRVH